MTDYLDLIEEEKFRNFVEQRLASTQENSQYSFPSDIPKLYKYRALSKYAVSDIVNMKLTATNIGNFNDLFDGAIHRHGKYDECKNKAENEWDELKQLQIGIGQIENLISKDQYIDMYIEYFKEDSRLKFRMLESLGTYVSCLSKEFDSILMWAHYAECNTGICLEYDFNKATSKKLLKKLYFL